jgi:amidohydrolase
MNNSIYEQDVIKRLLQKIYYAIKFIVSAIILLFVCPEAGAQKNLSSKFDAVVEKIQPKCIAWRRHLHQNPELDNREFKTAKFIADHLRTLGLEVTEGVAHTGVVGILKTGRPGPVIGLRAEMDAVPVAEPDSLPFASKAFTEYYGQQTGVMHACGHDLHMAILMSVAEILSGLKKDLNGTIKFIYQPAEEGAALGTGAALMVKEGILQDPKVDVVFALHVSPTIELGKIAYRPGRLYASATDFRIIVKGRSGLSAFPWTAVDPVVVSAQIIMGLQTILSRNLNITENAGIICISAINANTKPSLIPAQVEMQGTVRALSAADEKMMTERIRTIVLNTAEAAGATATLDIPYSSHTPPVFNHDAKPYSSPKHYRG